jgi:HEAT repeat protein
MRADRLGRVRAGRSLTPTMDDLAAHGVVFTTAYAQAPHSSYSLSSLHTGEYLHETLPLGQPQPLTTLADVLRAAGRHTVALYTQGVFFTEGERLDRYRESDFGFARATHVDRDADEQAAAAIGELDDLVRRGEPSGLLWVHFFDAHAPYQGSGPTAAAQYDDAVARIDTAMGRVLAHARRVLARDLVVAVTADHGEEFGDHGGVYHGSTLYDEQVRVPLVISAPGLTARRVSAPVELVDVAPTLVALAGARPAPTMRGRDLRAWMVHPPDAGSDTPPVFSAVNSRKMVRHGQWKLVADLTYGVYELFDLTADPGERRNLAGTYADLRETLHADLSAWLEALSDRGTARGAVARARVGDRAAIPGLTEIVRDPRASERDRTEAVELLAGFARRSLIDTLRPLLNDRTVAVRDAAAVALGNAGDRSAAPRLRDLVRSDAPEMRRRAGLALAKLGDHGALDALIETLWSPDESQVIDAIRALGALGDARALEPLMTVFPDDHVRYQVVLALGQLRDRSLYETLALTALRDPTDDARANAIAALGRLGDPRAIPLILGTIRHTHAERYAAEALGALGAVGPRIEGFDARTVEVTPNAFTSCGPHEDTLGWRYLGAHSCIGKPGGGRLPVSFYSRNGGLRLVVIRARRDDGPPVRIPLRLGAAVVATIPLSPRWEESRVPMRVPAGDVEIQFDLDGAGSPPPVLHLDHIVALPAR